MQKLNKVNGQTQTNINKHKEIQFEYVIQDAVTDDDMIKCNKVIG